MLAWASEHLDEILSVDRLTRQAHMSPRTFARRFRDETGTTPPAYRKSFTCVEQPDLGASTAS